MGREINLLINYPKSKRNLEERINNKTKKQREVARKFGKEFFDGHRNHGYGGYKYHSKFWTNVVPSFKAHWNLKKGDSLLDVGCGKGFMIYDFQRIIKGLDVYGIDISNYAINNSLDKIRNKVCVGNAKNLPFPDKSFDYVISINSIHNLNKKECAKALREITRVSKKGSFVTIDAYKNLHQKKRMFAWNLTAKTIMSDKEWKKFFKINSYNGDYYWFIP